MEKLLMPFTNQYALFTSGQEWLIVLVLVLVLFGGSKIPQLMRGVGKGISEFQEGIKEGKEKIQQGLKDAESEKTADKA